MYKSFFVWGVAFLLMGCSATDRDQPHENLKTGMWRAVLKLQEEELPFNFIVSSDSASGYNIHIINASERLLLDNITLRGDSVSIPLHIFDASFEARISGDTLEGLFVRHYDKDNTIPFLAVHGQQFRFKSNDSANLSHNFSGKYQVEFYNEKDTTQAIGVFLQRNDSVTGTFLTPTGDYRYLQGNIVNDTMFLSAFDGNHAYLFTALPVGQDSLNGLFYSGRTKKTKWKAWKDEKASLPDPESLTYLKPGFDRIEFSFPDVDGNPVSLDDEKYRNKVVILQISGTWCPNCMDETRFLAPWYDQNKDRGVEIIGLAYERKDDFEYARNRVKKMISALKVNYDFVIAGTNEKEKASRTLPMLNSVVSFPTTIFIGKDGKVKKIHTGFSGQGTGEFYEQFVEHFNETINDLLAAPEEGSATKNLQTSQ